MQCDTNVTSTIPVTDSAWPRRPISACAMTAAARTSAGGRPVRKPAAEAEADAGKTEAGPRSILEVAVLDAWLRGLSRPLVFPVLFSRAASENTSAQRPRSRRERERRRTWSASTPSLMLSKTLKTTVLKLPSRLSSRNRVIFHVCSGASQTTSTIRSSSCSRALL